MKYHKQCSCGRVATKLLGKNVVGIWVNCDCGSTNLIDYEKPKLKLILGEK